MMKKSLFVLVLIGGLALALASDSVVSEEGRPAQVVTTAAVYGTAPTPAAQSAAPVEGVYDGTASIRQAVSRSLPYLQKEGVAWIEEYGCVSCHQVPVMLWGQYAARDRGFEIDGKALEKNSRWTLERLHGPETETNWDGMGPVILGRPQQGELRLQLEGLAVHIAEKQEADGSWSAQGQLPFQRRAEEETHRVSTVWAALAIASVPVEPDGDLTKALHAARQRIDSWSTVDGESLEWRVVHLLYEATLGDPTRASTRLGELLALQHDDGGWPWLVGEGESDAFATGQVLYALARLNRPASTVAVERGRRFLVENQGVDGTWAVRSTLAREEGVIPTGRYWGTGWAVIGLLETLPTG